MVDLKSFKRWVLDVLGRACAERVIELNLPATVPSEVLFGWNQKYWGLEVANGHRTYCLFQAVANYYLCLRPRNSIGVCFGELHLNSKLSPYMGLITRDLNRWASWIRGICSAWKIAAALASFDKRSKVTLKVCLRDVYETYIDACGFSVFVTKALKSCYGNFTALNTLLKILTKNAVDSSKRQFYAINESHCTRLAYFYALICNECGKKCDKQRMYELAKIKLLTCFGFVPSYKLDMFKKLLALDLDLTSTLIMFYGMPRYSKAWLNIKRLRDNLANLNLEIKHVCWLNVDSKTESNLLFQFNFSIANIIGESYQLGPDTVTSSLIQQNE
ncbi:hypothetical protein CHOCRA_000012 [Candidatus Hodgkinia cicadicola]|nr:hypothetical protein CHOCRA_000012 [Candidatus Hodgkinia cicadicola]